MRVPTDAPATGSHSVERQIQWAAVIATKYESQAATARAYSLLVLPAFTTRLFPAVVPYWIILNPLKGITRPVRRPAAQSLSGHSTGTNLE